MEKQTNGVVIVGSGITALSALVELCNYPKWHTKQNPLICLTNKSILNASSGAGYAVIGGTGVCLAKAPRSRFRYLFQACVRGFKSWATLHAPNATITPIKQFYFFSGSLLSSKKKFDSLEKMLHGEGQNVASKKNTHTSLPLFLQNAIENIISQNYGLLQKNNSNHTYNNNYSSNININSQLKNKALENKALNNKTLLSFSFDDNFYINPAQLLQALYNKALVNGVQFKHQSVTSFKKTNDTTIINCTNNERHSQLHAKKVILTAGHQNAHLLSKSGYKIKTHSYWNEWIGFTKSCLPASVIKSLSTIKNAVQFHFAKHMLLYLPNCKNNEIALQLSCPTKQNYWHGACGLNKKLSSLNKCNESLKNFKQLWHKLFSTNMPPPKFYGSGYRTRNKTWMPTLDFLPGQQAFTAAEANTILIGNSYKNGIAMAPFFASSLHKLLSYSPEELNNAFLINDKANQNSLPLPHENAAQYNNEIGCYFSALPKEQLHYLLRMLVLKKNIAIPYKPQSTKNLKTQNESCWNYPFY